MSGPTGLEPGGSRTLVKLTQYVNDGVSAPAENYPQPSEVFNGNREIVGFYPDIFFETNQYNFTNPDGSTYTVIQPTWGGPPIVIGNPP